MNALEIQNIKKKFGSQTVLNGLSLQAPEHTVLGFLGQNGAGKTTTMKMILGFLKADEGQIKVFSEPVCFGRTKTNRFIGYLPDVPEFYGYMKAGEYLTLCGRITGLSPGLIKKRKEELLELVGLQGEKKRIQGYSRGMKQRLGIAQALFNEPQLLICDEPTSALDPLGRKEILTILDRVRQKTTVIFSTHILSDVERICDRVAVLHEGKIALSGTMEEIRKSHKTNSLEIVFQSEGDKQRFMEFPANYPLLKHAEVSAAKLILHAENTGKTEEMILQNLTDMSLLPQKIERLEPALENLFMEVIR